MSQIEAKLPGRKPTIGLIINTIERTARHINGQKVWLGVMDAAKERDVNLLCFHVDFMSKKAPNDTAKLLYELVDAQNVDGLIFSLYWDQAKFERYCSRFSSSLPIVNIRRQFDGFSTVIQDDYQGMRDSITHLVAEHGHRKIAYIPGEEGNPPCENRHRGYLDALAEHEIPFDPNLVVPWSVNQVETGKEGIRLLMDERKLRPGIDFDAVAVNNDRRAVGVLEALEERGVRVPYDIAVIGFDDIAGSEFTNPSLTTMNLRHYQMGKAAAETLFEILEEPKKTSDIVLVPPEMSIRQSCGCPLVDVQQVASKAKEKSQVEFEALLTAQREDIITAMIQSADGNDIVVAWVEPVLDAFTAEVTNGASGGFLEKLDEALRPMIAGDSDIFVWQSVITVMRSQLQPYLQGELDMLADDLWQQASILIGKIAYREQQHQSLQVSDQAQLLREISTELGTLFEIDQLMDGVADNLPRLGIPGAYVSLYENPDSPEESARLALAYTESGRALEKEDVSFPSRQLFPEPLIPQSGQSSFVVESLHFRDKPIGFSIFEVGPLDGNIYSNLGKEISSALQGALLVDQVKLKAEQLQAAVEVAEAISRVLDPRELVEQVVNLIRERFHLYYVGLFLVVDGSRLDYPPRQYAELHAGTGEAGHEMVENNHRLEVGGNSMIGKCVANREARIALDVGEDAVHFSNPLLPETRSELAVPLISRGEIIGALSIQSVNRAAFDQDDVAVFQTMAGQLATAIENARLFSQSEEANKRLQSELDQRVRDGWNRYLGRGK